MHYLKKILISIFIISTFFVLMSTSFADSTNSTTELRGIIEWYNSRTNTISIRTDNELLNVRLFNGTELLNGDTFEPMSRYDIKQGREIIIEHSGTKINNTLIAETVVISDSFSQISRINISSIEDIYTDKDGTILKIPQNICVLPSENFIEIWSGNIVDIDNVNKNSKVLLYTDGIDNYAYLISYYDLNEMVIFNGSSVFTSYIFNDEVITTQISDIKNVDGIDYILLNELVSSIGPNFSMYERGIVGTVAQKNSTTYAFMNNSLFVISTVTGIIDGIYEIVRIIDGELYIPVSYITNVFGISTISNNMSAYEETDYSIKLKITN